MGLAPKENKPPQQKHVYYDRRDTFSWIGTVCEYKHDAGVCSAAVFHLYRAPRFIVSAMASARYARMIQKEVLEQLTEMFSHDYSDSSHEEWKRQGIGHEILLEAMKPFLGGVIKKPTCVVCCSFQKGLLSRSNLSPNLRPTGLQLLMPFKVSGGLENL